MDFMKILVTVKRVVDYNVHIRVRADGSGVETANVKMSMNPFDEIAVEEAVRLKEKRDSVEVVAVSIGDTKAEETIRTALAMGADRGIRVDCNQFLEPLAVAAVLRKIVKREAADFVIMGKQAIDDDYSQTAQMLAASLGWAQATFISELRLKDGEAEVAREVDGGLERIAVKLPAVFSADLRLNTPRYASLPNIMRARSKPITAESPADLGVTVKNTLVVQEVTEPKPRPQGTIVADVDELIGKLKNEAGVI